MRLKLEQILFSQGFGTRYDCRSLVRSGQVKINQVVKTDPDETVETQNLKFEVRGQLWLYKEKAIIALNKPSGYECSQKPIHHPSVMTLLPSPLRRRGVQPVGRLDEDTTGLLILTDAVNTPALICFSNDSFKVCYWMEKKFQLKLLS